MESIYGINPVREALKSRGRAIQYVAVARERHDDRLQKLIEECKHAGVSVRLINRQDLDRLAGNGGHQGAVAITSAKKYCDIDDLLTNRRGEHALLVVLDGVEDPHNLGAIVRTALAAGAHGVVIPERRAAGLTDTVARASAGALAHLPVAKVTNLVRTMEELKEAGYWLVGLDEQGDKNYTEVDYTSPVGIVLGSEGQGLHELTRKRCDFVVSLPTTGPVKSLNVSVAAGVVLFEALRQRRSSSRKV